MKASSLVFVLARGANGWATAIHDGQVKKIDGISSRDHSPACKQELSATF